ncbi:DUF4124 domain-containing protein [Stutzerimonas azotifigens]|uniref:DUF4124 domain-containing protein n=1 Tax=Stutzerimonas azotifigens TaxID=291995 RepID=UPI000424E6DD|nr:DUF4124 domain-containing protein [Stutzerimonas azotifigens]
MKARCRLALSLLILAQPAAAEVYTYVDEQGNRVFTDRPHSGEARSVEVRPSNRMSLPAPPRTAAAASEPRTVKLAPQRYERVWIEQPEADATVRDNAGNLTVSAASEPPLHPGDRFRVLLDGQPVDDPERPLFLGNIDRGTHQLAVEIVASNGSVLGTSASQPVHVKRMSLVQRRRANPCQPDDYGVRLECPLKDKPKEKKDIPFVPFF